MNKIIKKIFDNTNYDYYKLPILDWNNKYMNSVDYIDNIKVEDMMYSVMKGEDENGRIFISFKLTVENENKKEKKVITLFQRYQDCNNTWVFGSPYRFYFHNSLLDYNIIKIYNIILKNNKYKYKSDTNIYI